MYWKPSVCLCLGLTFFASQMLVAQKGKVRYADLNASATIRGNTPEAVVPCPDDDGLPKDRLTADGLGPIVGSSGNWQSGFGAFLRFDGEFSMDIDVGSGRRILLDFRDVLLPPSAVFHRKTFDCALLEKFHINTNVIDPGTGEQAEHGMRHMPIGATWKSRIKAGWSDAYGTLYNIRFNPTDYPGSDLVDVTRTGDSSWSIEALPSYRARLVSPAQSVKGKSPGPTDEGTYSLPFRIDFTVP
jgi:hypothetical protein